MDVCDSKSTREFEHALTCIQLSPLQQSVVIGRYIPLIRTISNRTRIVSILFNTSRIIITVGSLIVPALLSIQGLGNTNPEIYWSTWVVSLLVTICNALVSLFKYDKRYYYLNTILERLISEGWQYIELTGRYSGYNTRGAIPTHENQFIYFCHAVEKIRMKQVEEEYYKINESNTQANSQTVVTQEVKGLIPPTPQQGELMDIPTEIVSAINHQLSQPQIEDAEKGRQKERNEKDKTDRQVESVSVSFDM
jgi:hypothetical protein